MKFKWVKDLQMLRFFKKEKRREKVREKDLNKRKIWPYSSFFFLGGGIL
jgi:hypothetical protein